MDTRLLTLKQLYDEVVNREILDTRIPVVYDGKDIIITPEIAALFYPDSNGRLQPLVDTSGIVSINGTTIEASAVSSNLHLGRIATGVVPNGSVAQIGERTESEAGNSITRKRQARKGVVAATFDGAGSLAATGLIPALAAYYGVIDSVRWFCDSTDAAVNFTFQDGAATAVTAFTPTAGIVATQTILGDVVDDIANIPLFTTLDNSAISVLCADNSGPAAGEITFIVTYHYET